MHSSVGSHGSYGNVESAQSSPSVVADGVRLSRLRVEPRELSRDLGELLKSR
jgi:hypothetical protein